MRWSIHDAQTWSRGLDWYKDVVVEVRVCVRVHLDSLDINIMSSGGISSCRASRIMSGRGDPFGKKNSWGHGLEKQGLYLIVLSRQYHLFSIVPLVICTAQVVDQGLGALANSTCTLHFRSFLIAMYSQVCTSLRVNINEHWMWYRAT